ncbi:unnamed protein product [Linum trigynum]|uniref:Uncharacterized protein n=1 Tax=Linum trigynum TaxID=586398 RepID=A0AAV2F7I3_9ROSI
MEAQRMRNAIVIPLGLLIVIVAAAMTYHCEAVKDISETSTSPEKIPSPGVGNGRSLDWDCCNEKVKYCCTSSPAQASLAQSPSSATSHPVDYNAATTRP